MERCFPFLLFSCCAGLGLEIPLLWKLLLLLLLRKQLLLLRPTLFKPLLLEQLCSKLLRPPSFSPTFCNTAPTSGTSTYSTTTWPPLFRQVRLQPLLPLIQQALLMDPRDCRLVTVSCCCCCCCCGTPPSPTSRPIDYPPCRRSPCGTRKVVGCQNGRRSPTFRVLTPTRARHIDGRWLLARSPKGCRVHVAMEEAVAP